MIRYQEFMLDLIQDHTTLSEAESHAHKLAAEIDAARSLKKLNFRIEYAREELRATKDYIHNIKKQMAAEEEWTK